MKTTLLLSFILITANGFSQSLYSSQFWNHSATFNPAMSGFLYKQHHALGIPGTISKGRFIQGINLETNFRIKEKHGLGISFHSESEYYETNLNYNYQFNIGEEGVLSAGVGLGLCHTIEYNYYPYPHFYSDRPQKHFNLNLGVAYRMKNLSVGLSLQNTTTSGYREYYLPINEKAPLLSLQSAYEIPVGDKFKLTPRVLVATNFQTDDFIGKTEMFGKINLTAHYAERVSLGLGYASLNRFSANIGWDIKGKFRMSYEVSSRPNLWSIETLQSKFTHDLTLGYFLK